MIRTRPVFAPVVRPSLRTPAARLAGVTLIFVLAPAGSSSDPGGGDLALQRRVCVNPRGEVVVVAGGATCP